MSTRLGRVGDLAEQVRGVSYEKEDASTSPKAGHLPILRAGNITDDGLVFDDLVYVPSERISDKQRIRRHDVVIAASSGSLDVVGKAAPALADFDGGFGAFCKVLRPNDKVHPGYFAQFFKTQDYRRRVSALAAGANINNLRNEHLDEMPIPLPPLPEQKRIAEVLDRAEELRATRRAALAQIEGLAKAIFLDLFGDPARNPRGWPIQTVAQLCEVKGGKRLPKGEEYSPTPTPFRYIRVTDLKGGTVDESALVYLTPEVQSSIARYVVNAGDVIISIAGSIGVVAPVPPSLEGANLTENAAKLVPRVGDVYNHVFLAVVLQTPFAQQQIVTHIGQVTIGKLALFRIEKIHLPVPPLTLQDEFASRLAGVHRLRATHHASLAKLDSLFAALQYRAFRGEL